MGKYIDKDALIAEVERRKEKCDTFYDIALSNNVELAKVAIEEQKRQYNSLLSFINTLEVKEADLNEEIEKCLKNHNMLAVGKKDFTNIARRFFELGMTVSNKA